MSDAKHSPLKWHLESGSFEYVLNTNGDTVCICDNVNDSELIVRAVNSHADLIMGLRKAIPYIDRVYSDQRMYAAPNQIQTKSLLDDLRSLLELSAISNAEKL